MHAGDAHGLTRLYLSSQSTSGVVRFDSVTSDLRDIIIIIINIVFRSTIHVPVSPTAPTSVRVIIRIISYNRQ